MYLFFKFIFINIIHIDLTVDIQHILKNNLVFFSQRFDDLELSFNQMEYINKFEYF